MFKLSRMARHRGSFSKILRNTSSSSYPAEADVVVIGGGIIGSSITYHLAKLSGGSQNVVMLERDKVTSGTTWHAAGLMVTFGSLSETSTEMRKYTKELYSHILEDETGQNTGFKPCGFIELATNEDRLEEYRRVAAFNRYCGIDVQEISAEEVKEKFPLCDVADVLAGFYVPTDGRVNPVDATAAFVKGARIYGASIYEDTPVSELLWESTKRQGGRSVTGVKLENGIEIKAKKVINCAGMWARQFNEQANIICPNQAAEHYYLVTDTMDDVDPNWPVVEDPSSYTYIRPEGGGLMVGLFEGEAAAWNVESIPNNFSFGEITPDYERMEPYLLKAMNRVPRTMEVGAKTFFCGPESFTPDLSPILGESPEIDNFYIAAGLNSIGILTGGGVGRLVAQWALDGYSDMDVTGVAPARFQQYQMTSKYRRDRVQEMLGKVYKCHYPNDSPKSGRGAKRSPLYHQLQDRGAFFRDVSGVESADWYTHDGNTPDENSNPLTWGKPNWFQNWKDEHDACRNHVVLMDMSFMSKFRVRGKNAGNLLNRLSTANVDDACSRVTYTQWLNERGTVEADLTVAKIDHEEYMVVATDTMHRWTEAWMQRNICEVDPSIQINDITNSLAQINIQGPNSRLLLQSITDMNMSNESFEFRDARYISIGYAQVLCMRITYLGELGYELYVPVDQVGHVYDIIVNAGAAGGVLGAQPLRHAGLKALASLRLEKGYRDYGHDVDNTDPIHMTGLAFTCDFEKPGSFIGADAAWAHKLELTDGKGSGAMKLKKRLVNVLCCDPDPMLYHGEVLFKDNLAGNYSVNTVLYVVDECL